MKLWTNLEAVANLGFGHLLHPPVLKALTFRRKYGFSVDRCAAQANALT